MPPEVTGTRVYLLLGLGAALAGLGLPLLTHAPNRLLSGRAVPWEALPLPLVIGLGLALLTIFAAGTVPRLSVKTRALLALAAALAVPPLYLWGAGMVADAQASPLGRTAFGSGGWVLVGLAGLLAVDAGKRLALPPAGRGLLLLLGLAPAVLLLTTGTLDNLALLKEYAAKRDAFAEAVFRHGEIVGLALLPTLALGLPLGVRLHRNPALKAPVLSGLGLIQTIPSIALFGLLMAPLSELAALFPALGRLGISGIGLAPATVALTLYAILPVTRNMAEGLAGVPAATLDAARGMGLTVRQIFWQVELPLALPVILSGVRITLVQTVGLAAVTALIGAGGLGALMFQGVFANAGNLVLLGAVPIVLLALILDALFRLLAALAQRGRTT